jgi:GTPase SAR1 family protein
MFSFLKNSWLGRAVFDIDAQRISVGLSKDEKMIQHAAFPRIVVVGDESVAKSSVLNILMQRDVLPRGSDIKTRRIVTIRLRFQEESKVSRMILKLPSLKEPIETNDDNVILKALEMDFETIKTSQAGIAKEEGELTIYGSHFPSCDLVDIPGMMIVSQTDEPSLMPTLVKDLVLKAIQVPNSIILAIIDANTRERQSPTIGLLKQTKTDLTIIKVFTKPDLAIRPEEEDEMGEFVNHLNNIDVLLPSERVVSLKSNYALNPNYQLIAENEEKFFMENLGLSRYNELKAKLGIRSLLSIISSLSEKSCREAWKLEETKRYQTDLDNYLLQVELLGTEYDSQEIASFIVNHLFSKPRLVELMDTAWIDSKFTFNVPSILDDRTEIFIVQFVEIFKKLFLHEINIIFNDPITKLNRFSKFKTDLIQSVEAIFKANIPELETRWQELSNFLNNLHDSQPSFNNWSWKHSACCCLAQTILMKLAIVKNSKLQDGFLDYFSQFDHVENDATLQTRCDLMKKIEALQNILTML